MPFFTIGMEPQSVEPAKAGMNTNTKIVIGVIVVAFLFGGVSYFMKGKNPSMNGVDDRNLESSAPLEGINSNAQNPNSETSVPSGQGSLSSIWTMSGNHKCDVSMLDPKVSASGTVYVSGGKIRADFNVEVPQLAGKTMTASMIQKDGEVYSWTNMYPQGFKTKVVANSDPLSSAGSTGLSSNASVSYNCQAWSPNGSMFDLPSGVTFTEATKK